MQWKEIASENKWVLQDNGDIAAEIFSYDKEKIKNKYQAKAIISAIYLGKKRFSRSEKKKNDWLAITRKFASLPERERYIEAKKKEILKYIQIRFS